VPPLVVGLTVVAFGTSAPEMAVSAAASLGGDPDIAVGNVVGSNIFNVLLILGLSALVAPLVVARQLVREQVPVMVAVSGLLWLVALDGRVGRAEGGLLFTGIVLYTAVLIVRGAARTTRRRRPEPMPQAVPPAARSWPSRSRARSWAWACWCWAPGGWWRRRARRPSPWACRTWWWA